MKRLTLFFVSWLVLLPLMAQQPNITLKGTTTNAAGKSIALYKYSDALSRNEVLLDEINDENHFQLKSYANYPMLIFVQIENYSQSFVVEPGRTYEMFLPEFDWNLDEKRNIHLAPEALPFRFLNLPKDEVNLSIQRFDEVVDSFVYENRIHLDFKFWPNKLYFDTLLMVVEKLAPNTSNEYFNRYKTFRLASLRYQFGFLGKTKMYDTYIREQPIRYYDENYMDFFFSLFQKSVSNGSRYLKVREVAEFVDKSQIGSFLDSLGLDPLLRNEQVRELVALQALSEAYYHGYYYKRDKVVKMIELLMQQTKFKEHKQLAENLLDKFRQESEETRLPSFTLPNVDKEPVSIDAFKGKWVYLSFVRVGEPAAIGELDAMAHFYDTICALDSNVVFITIDCDREFQKMYHLLKNNKRGNRYRWTWLHFDGNYALLQRYGIVSYPSFVLLTPNGQRRYSVTPAPSSGFLLFPPWRKRAEEKKSKFFLDNE